MRFVCVGFDVRQWPWSGRYGVDDSCWETNEEARIELMTKFSIVENEYQLLEIGTTELLADISRYIGDRQDCDLLAVEFPRGAVQVLDRRYGYTTSSIDVDLTGLTFRGFDICDFNGLFSILHNPELDVADLIPASELDRALEVMQIANVMDRGHCPFVVAKVYSLKN